MLTPGRPSGVSSGESARSTPPSASQPMTDAAYPVASWAAVRAHAGVSAVTMSRAAVIGNASANVSSIGTELIVSIVLCPLSLVPGPKYSGRTGDEGPHAVKALHHECRPHDQAGPADQHRQGPRRVRDAREHSDDERRRHEGGRARARGAGAGPAGVRRRGDLPV